MPVMRFGGWGWGAYFAEKKIDIVEICQNKVGLSPSKKKLFLFASMKVL